MKSVLIKILLVVVIATCGYFLYGYFFDKTEKYLHDLQSGNVVAINKAMYYLGEDKKKDAVPVLIKLVNNEQPKTVRLSAMKALGKIYTRGIADALLGLLVKGEDKIQIAAVDALGKIKNKRATKPLISILSYKDSQLSVIRALGNIGDKSAVPALEKMVNDPDKFVSHNATLALKNIGESK
jgi:HEAT repeat protein